MQWWDGCRRLHGDAYWLSAPGLVTTWTGPVERLPNLLIGPAWLGFALPSASGSASDSVSSNRAAGGAPFRRRLSGFGRSVLPIDVYARVTDHILESLARGTVPWRKPWSGGESGLPKNLASKRPYRGVNVFLLGCMPYSSPYWLTFKQAKEFGGHVRRGEKSSVVVFWKWIEKEKPESGEMDRFPLLRYYNVFNAEQCELPAGAVPVPPSDSGAVFEPIAACERIVAEMPARPAIRYAGSVACYRPADDTVCMPERERFDGPEPCYSTLFHELVHSTGHPSRLNRATLTDAAPFGSRTYGKEELIAEMGAAFLCGFSGIENGTIENSAAYIAGWLRTIREDKRLVVHAAAAAQRAADFILGRCYGSEDTSLTRATTNAQLRTSTALVPLCFAVSPGARPVRTGRIFSGDSKPYRSSWQAEVPDSLPTRGAKV